MRLLREGLKIKHILGALALFLVAAPLAAVVSNRFLENRALDRVERDWNDLRMACMNYGLDRCGVYYPPDTAERRKEEPGFPLTFEFDGDFITRRPTGKKQEPVSFWFPLTTPIAFVREIPLDPFHPGHRYGYTCWNLHDSYPVLAFFYSPGPDRKTDLPLSELRERIERYFQGRPRLIWFPSRIMEPCGRCSGLTCTIPRGVETKAGISSGFWMAPMNRGDSVIIRGSSRPPLRLNCRLGKTTFPSSQPIAGRRGMNCLRRARIGK
jgi:hypothetical protein